MSTNPSFGISALKPVSTARCYECEISGLCFLYLEVHDSTSHDVASLRLDSAVLRQTHIVITDAERWMRVKSHPNTGLGTSTCSSAMDVLQRPIIPLMKRSRGVVLNATNSICNTCGLSPSRSTYNTSANSESL